MSLENTVAVVVDAACVTGCPSFRKTPRLITRSRLVGGSVLKYLNTLRFQPVKGFLIVYIQHRENTPVEVKQELQKVWESAGYLTRWTVNNADEYVVTETQRLIATSPENFPAMLVLVSSDFRLAKRLAEISAATCRQFWMIGSMNNTKRLTQERFTTLEQVVLHFHRSEQSWSVLDRV